jgi:hypothetical protein
MKNIFICSVGEPSDDGEFWPKQVKVFWYNLILNWLLTNSTQLSPSREAVTCAGTQKLLNIFFFETEDSLPCSQEPFTGLSPELDRFST